MNSKQKKVIYLLRFALRPDISSQENFLSSGFSYLEFVLLYYIDFLFHLDKDYLPIDKDFIFPANESFIVVSINITNDDIAEMVSEGFTVSLSASLMDSIFVKLNNSRQQATVTINEDDSKYCGQKTTK